jgi:hypothetical protein
MKNTNRVSLATITKLAETMKNNTTELNLGQIDGKDVIVVVSRTLTTEQIYGICAAMQIPPFADDAGASVYLPFGEVANFKVALVRAYCDIELPDDVMEAHEICSSVNLFQKLHDALKDTDVYNHLLMIQERYSQYHRLMSSGLSSLEKAFSNIDMGALEKLMPEFSELLQETTPSENNE